MKNYNMDELVEKAREIADSEDVYFESIGIRFQEEEFELGPIDHCSHVWVDGEDTGEELDGISAINYKTAKWATEQASGYYHCKHIAILGSNDAHSGEDVAEIVMKNAEVLYIVK